MMCNSNAAAVESHPIVLTSAGTGDSETFLGVETAPNSGLFRIMPPVPTRDERPAAMRQGDGIMETLRNDTVTATIDAGGTNRAVATILIARVPSSLTAAPICRRRRPRHAARPPTADCLRSFIKAMVARPRRIR
jgi:hypothetical protein